MEAIGCDVSKRWIDVARPDGSGATRIGNSSSEIESFVKALPANSLVGMEATGEFHEALADQLASAGHRVYVINPRWIHAYAKGLGMRGKTDRTDAQVIARYLQAEHAGLHRYQPPSAEERELRSLLQRRLAAAKLMATAKQSLGIEAQSLTPALKALCKDLERRIAKLLGSRPDWACLARRLRQIPGVGGMTAAQLVSTFLRVRFTRVEAFIAHTGTDPRPNDSGNKRGRRALSHRGDRALRSLLYMAAMTASRHPDWRPYYQAQQAKGLAPTPALIVVARRIARIAFSLFKSGTSYDPARFAAPAA